MKCYKYKERIVQAEELREHDRRCVLGNILTMEELHERDLRTVVV
ncbi:MAG TPA: hypothetical protein PK014_06610 [Thermoanaerobaculia bacterium]|nr:hypothetical protein [Thermoanaerobaculia bacterium]HUM29424.1 hypothetical protein [Thermoanaerobaculia bacterium]HXK67670.1 hypothetical protein [Thermoanaerobaculia bacterium]